MAAAAAHAVWTKRNGTNSERVPSPVRIQALDKALGNSLTDVVCYQQSGRSTNYYCAFGLVEHGTRYRFRLYIGIYTLDEDELLFESRASPYTIAVYAHGLVTSDQTLVTSLWVDYWHPPLTRLQIGTLRNLTTWKMDDAETVTRTWCTLV